MKNLYKAPLLVSCLYVAALCVSFTQAAAQTLVVRASESSLRKIAIKTVMPIYPEESIKRGAKGVAVAELVFDTTGDVSTVEVLEAPDSSIGQAIINATKQWKFRPTNVKGGGAVSVRGKLTFYYVIDEKGEGRVENPRQYK